MPMLRQLSVACLAVAAPLLRQAVLARLFGDATWSEGDAPAFLLFRLRKK